MPDTVPLKVFKNTAPTNSNHHRPRTLVIGKTSRGQTDLHESECVPLHTTSRSSSIDAEEPTGRSWAIRHPIKKRRKRKRKIQEERERMRKIKGASIPTPIPDTQTTQQRDTRADRISPHRTRSTEIPSATPTAGNGTEIPSVRFQQCRKKWQGNQQPPSAARRSPRGGTATDLPTRLPNTPAQPQSLSRDR